jgi:DnaA family protein
MKQLLLKLDAARPQTLESFEVGQHAELVALLRRFMQHQPGSFGEHAAYIWGESGAGKSHLLHAIESDSMSRESTSRFITPDSALADFEHASEISLYLLDDCQDFDDLQQIAAFNLYNQVKEHKGFFVATGTLPPALLTVREDFRTRLGWSLIYQLQGLSDQEKIAALERAAVARGVTIPDGVLPYLITHFDRDMPSLANMLNALINHSLEVKHPITLPFLREVIQQQKVSNG